MLLIFILLPNKNLFSQDEKKSSKPDSKKKTKSFASIVSEATKDEGLFNVYKKEEKYYFEIPDSLIGREMLMVTRVAKMSVSIPLTQHKLNGIWMILIFQYLVVLPRHLIQFRSQLILFLHLYRSLKQQDLQPILLIRQ